MAEFADLDWSPAQLRLYLERTADEARRYTEHLIEAEHERLNTYREHVDALFAENQRATEMAEREREKSAQALATQLAGQIQQGDAALRDHIGQQVQQLQILLEGTRREIDIRTNEQQKAISKQEMATNDRFSSVNEFRAQLSDQATKFLPREVAESQLNEIGKLLDQAKDERAQALPRETYDRSQEEWATWRQRVENQLVGVAVLKAEEDKDKDTSRAWGIAGVGFVLTLVSILIVAADVLTP